MKKFKKLICFMLSTVMVLSMAGFTGDEGEITPNTGVKLPWVDTCIFENLDYMSTLALKDDYYAYVNYDWASRQVRDFTNDISFFAETEWRGYDKRSELCADESFHSTELDLIRDAKEIYCDWDYRNSLGVEPLKKYLAYIDEIQTLDDVSAYMIDNGKNPMAVSLLNMQALNNDVNDDLSLVLMRPSFTIEDFGNYNYLTDSGFREKDIVERRVTYILSRCGYSKREIKKVLKSGFRMEYKMQNTGKKEYNNLSDIRTKEDVLALAGDYPFADFLTHYKMDEIDSFTGQLDYLDKLETIYKEKNVEDMKAFFKLNLAYNSLIYLDKEALDMSIDTKIDKTNKFAERIERTTDFYFFYLIADSSFSAAMDQAYIDAYYNEDTANEIHEMITEIKAKYRELIQSNEFLSEESKQSAILKLERMGEHVMKPDNTADYTGVSVIKKSEGGTFLDTLCVMNGLKYEIMARRINNKHDLNYWDIYDSDFSTVRRNAFYYGSQNSMYINMGILEEPMYNADYPYEKKLAILGTIIGHEISHGFDNKGILRDAYGKPNAAVKSDELANWDKMADRIRTHLSTIQPFDESGRYNKNSGITGEAIADFEGVHVCLLMAEDCENFNYDLFFRSFAEHWRAMDTKGGEIKDIKSSSHPLQFIRVNYTLMQFEKFYETYDIKPGDGMYLAPEERIVIW